MSKKPHWHLDTGKDSYSLVNNLDVVKLRQMRIYVLAMAAFSPIEPNYQLSAFCQAPKC